MEELKQVIIEKWPVILQYALMFVAYFLVFIYRSKIMNTRLNLNTMFRERTEQINSLDKSLRKDIDKEREMIQKELEESKQKYQDAVDKIVNLEKALSNLNSAVQDILGME